MAEAAARRTPPAHPLTQRLTLVVCVARIILFATLMTVAACIPVLVEDCGVGAAGRSAC